LIYLYIDWLAGINCLTLLWMISAKIYIFFKWQSQLIIFIFI
jgi:hypothetical protein